MERLLTWMVLAALAFVAVGCQQSTKTAEVGLAPEPLATVDAYQGPVTPVPEPFPAAPQPVYPTTPDATAGGTAASGAPNITVNTNVTAPAAPRGASYTVQRGDTLWSIARKLYGNGQKWQQLAAANGINNPKSLREGQTLVIP